MCFDIEGVKIPTVAYLGFSAETGELSDNHDIISVESRNLYNSQQFMESQKKGGKSGGKQKGKGYDPNRDPRRGGWGWFLIKMVLCFVVVGGAYVGYTVYRTSKRSSRF